MAISFNGTSRVATLSSGTVSLNVVDLYTQWKNWVAAGNAQYLPMFAPVGGDPIDSGAGTSIPLYAFLLHGWKIKPQEAHHTLNVSGGVLLVEGGGDPFINTSGNYVVRISYSQPVQAITVATGGGGGSSLSAADVWAHLIEGTLTAEQVSRILLSVLAGKVTGAGSGTEHFRDLTNTKDRVLVSVDANGNRTAVTLDGT